MFIVYLYPVQCLLYVCILYNVYCMSVSYTMFIVCLYPIQCTQNWIYFSKILLSSGAVANLRKATVTFVMSVCVSVCESSVCLSVRLWVRPSVSHLSVSVLLWVHMSVSVRLWVMCLCPSVFESICLCPSVCESSVCVLPSLSPSVCVRPSLSPSVCVRPSVSVRLWVHLSVSVRLWVICLCPSVFESICLCPSVCESICLCLSVCESICLCPSVCESICLCVRHREKFGSRWRNFMKFNMWGFFENLQRKCVLLEPDKNNGHITGRLMNIYDNISLLLELKLKAPETCTAKIVK
jgi:hypothetical protein